MVHSPYSEHLPRGIERYTLSLVPHGAKNQFAFSNLHLAFNKGLKPHSQPVSDAAEG
jgi:hypothetical protein